MNDWLATLARHADHDIVRVVVVATRGSAPRAAGACMLVDAEGQIGTIGGGHLEFHAAQIARDMLTNRQDARLDRFTLGATLGQCCGGAVELWFERWGACDRDFVDAALRQRANGHWQLATRIGPTTDAVQRALQPLAAGSDAHASSAHRTASHFIEPLAAAGTPLYLFGAGHVGQALVRVLAGLPLAITWIDSRAELFPAMLMPASTASTVTTTTALPPVPLAGQFDTPLETRIADDPAAEVRLAPPATHYLIMTHSHDLDYAICRAALARGDAASVGLIGSATKAARFGHRLAAHGIDTAGLTCPIGSLPVGSKLPTAIAISVAAQLLERLEQPGRQAVLPTATTRRASA